MTTAAAVTIGLYFSRYTTDQIDAAYGVLCNVDNYLDRDVLAAKGNIEGYLFRSTR